jgi:hypothetical protein
MILPVLQPYLAPPDPDVAPENILLNICITRHKKVLLRSGVMGKSVQQEEKTTVLRVLQK